MKRRTFVQLMSAATPTSLISSRVALGTDRKRAAVDTADPTVFVREDFHYLSGIAPPLVREDLTKTIDLLVGTAVDTLIFQLAPRGGMCLFDTRVGQRHGTNVKKWTHPVNYRDGRHVRQMIAEGWDLPQIFCDRCHEEGMFFIASAHLNIGSGTTESSRGIGRTSDFVLSNSRFRVGDDPDPRAKNLSPVRLNFMYSQVREERLRVLEELLSRYETDGVEVLTEVLPLCRYNQVNECAVLLTQWLRDLKKIALKAEEDQNRRKRIFFRVPSNPATWKAVGFDVATWISEGLVDVLICTSNDPEALDQDLSLSMAVSLARGTPCRVLATTGSTLGRKLNSKPNEKMIWAAAANAYQQGADGFGLNEFPRTQEMAFLGDMYEALRPLASPNLLATADKIYHVRNQPTSEPSFGSGLPGVEPLVPKILEEGQPQEMPLRVADDLHHWHRLDRLKSVKLRLRLGNLEPSLNDVRIELNGQPLPESILEITDLNYRFLREGVAYQGSQIYQFLLPPEHYPRRGVNVVTVTLLRKDPEVDMAFTLADVDCSIQYRLHRHFDDHPIEY